MLRFGARYCCYFASVLLSCLITWRELYQAPYTGSSMHYRSICAGKSGTSYFMSIPYEVPLEIDTSVCRFHESPQAALQWSTRIRRVQWGCHFTKGWYELKIKMLWKLFLFRYFYFDNSIRSQFCICHDSWAVVAYAKLRLDWIVIFYKRGGCIFSRFV